MADQQGQFKLADMDPTPPVERPKTKGAYSLMDVEPYPKGGKLPDTLPDITNDDLKRWGRSALDYLPAIAGTGAAIFAPEALPAYPLVSGMISAGAGGLAGEGVRQGTLAA